MRLNRTAALEIIPAVRAKCAATAGIQNSANAAITGPVIAESSISASHRLRGWPRIFLIGQSYRSGPLDGEFDAV